MKRLFIGALILCFGHVSTVAQSTITSFDALLHALTSGTTVKATVYLENCTRAYSGSKKKEKLPAVIFGHVIQSYDYYPRNTQNNNKAYVSMSFTQFGQFTAHKNGWYHYREIQVYEDEGVIIIDRMINPLTFENETNEVFETTLYNGELEQAGAYFYSTNF